MFIYFNQTYEFQSIRTCLETKKKNERIFGEKDQHDLTLALLFDGF